MKFSKDELYAVPMAQLVDFSFDEKTVAVFPDMINRSVPGYSLMQSLTGLIARQSVRSRTKVYDLGCSLGASTLSILNSVEIRDYELVLVDQSASMLASCRDIFAQNPNPIPIEFKHSDVREITVTNASMVILNLVLQFVLPQDRYTLLSGIYAGLNEGGVLLLSEKIILPECSNNSLIEELYFEFKKRSGYSELEISQKRKALDRIMQPESITTHQKRLEDIGFRQVVPIFQALNFVSMLAVK